MHRNVLVSQPQLSTAQRKTPRSSLSRRDRLFRVQIGVAAGKSNRQIAKLLGVDEGTVRRDRLTLLLSKEDLQAVRAGAAVEPLLQKQERRKAATAREKQEIAEMQSLFLTNRLARLVDRWLEQFPIGSPNKLHVISGVDVLSWHYQSPAGAFIPDSRIQATIEAAKPNCPPPPEAPLLIEYAKAWLFRWIVLVEPDKAVRDRALTKVRQELERQSPYC
jgi:transposase